MSPEFGFEDLERLKVYLASVRRTHVATMNHYASEDGKGFWHQPSKKQEASLSSTATCVSSLVRAGLWTTKNRAWGKSEDVAARLLKEPWKSAGLLPNNPFGLSFIAEGVLDLVSIEPYSRADEDMATIKDRIIPLLIAELNKANESLDMAGSVRIAPYPPSAYLTQLAFRVLKRTGDLNSEITKKVRAWATTEIQRQVALITTHSRISDPLQLGYALTLAANASVDELTSPEEKALTRESLRLFFDAQQSDGMWRLSQPLFHYPDVGNAHCFEYELLTQMLYAETLQEELLQYLPKLERTALRLKHTSYDLGGGEGAVGWASGHHPQIAGPESWSTACVYDFVHSLDRLLAEAIRQALFSELHAVYSPPRQPAPKKSEFAPGFLDATLVVNEVSVSLIDTIQNSFVKPIEAERATVSNGGRLKQTTPMSAILFGPPGTSKTELAKIVSNQLNWPLLSVDPSYLVQDGIDHVYARSNRLFSMLAMAEQIVVLLDEFDEMGKDRMQSPDILSRFITTSMLPKLAAINKERKIVFLLATNYVSSFDAAFSRGGRFDMILQVMPPTLAAKLGKAEWANPLKAALDGLASKPTKQKAAQDAIEDLTYLEMVQLMARLSSGADTYDEILAAQSSGTLARLNGEKSWKETSKEDRKVIRVPS